LILRQLSGLARELLSIYGVLRRPSVERIKLSDINVDINNERLLRKRECQLNWRTMRRITFPGFVAGLVALIAVLLGGCGGGGGGASSAGANSPNTGANGAPTITGSPASSVAAGQAYSFQPSATDPNGDQLTFSVTNLPGWATFNTSNGRISGTPTAAQVGAYSDIRISVSDGATNVSLAAFSITVNEMGTGTATLSWAPPTSNSDGSTLTNLAGYQVLWGRSVNNLDQSVSLDNPSINRYVVENLATGTWYFAVVAVNTAGVASPPSNTSNKTIT
jgi:hypothetical protein